MNVDVLLNRQTRMQLTQYKKE